MNLWLGFGVGLAIGAYTLSQRLGEMVGTEEDVEYLARVLIMEHGSVGPGREWAGIAWVVKNRVESWKYPGTVRGVVTSRGWSGSSSYVERIQGPRPTESRNWLLAVEFANQFVNGQWPNEIGDRTHMCHGRSCGEIPEGGLRADGKMKCLGGVLLPLWAIPRSDPDSTAADQEPIKIGITYFS